jgi:hypothetical protein
MASPQWQKVFLMGQKVRGAAALKLLRVIKRGYAHIIGENEELV